MRTPRSHNAPPHESCNCSFCRQILTTKIIVASTPSRGPPVKNAIALSSARRLRLFFRRGRSSTTPSLQSDELHFSSALDVASRKMQVGGLLFSFRRQEAAPRRTVCSASQHARPAAAPPRRRSSCASLLLFLFASILLSTTERSTTTPKGTEAGGKKINRRPKRSPPNGDGRRRRGAPSPRRRRAARPRGGSNPTRPPPDYFFRRENLSTSLCEKKPCIPEAICRATTLHTKSRSY